MLWLRSYLQPIGSVWLCTVQSMCQAKLPSSQRSTFAFAELLWRLQRVASAQHAEAVALRDEVYNLVWQVHAIAGKELETSKKSSANSHSRCADANCFFDCMQVAMAECSQGSKEGFAKLICGVAKQGL